MQLRISTTAWLAILVTTGMAVLCPPALAKTWRVEKDGSGDFTIIQQALDAAADGDSILIGPGRFDDIEKRAVSAATLAAVMFVNNSDLAIIGADSSLTRIGPPTQTDLFQGVAVVGAIIDTGFSGNRVEQVTFEHTNSLVNLDVGATFSSCRFYFSKKQGVSGGGGVRLDNVNGASFASCSFYIHEAGQTAIVSFVGGRNPNLTIADCLFEQRVTNLCGCSTVQIEGADSLRVTGSTFINGTIGLIASSGRGVQVSDCVFEGQEFVGILTDGDSRGSSEVTIRGNRFITPGSAAVQVSSFTEFLALDCVFEPGTLAGIWIEGALTTAIHNCDILPGAHHSVRVEVPAVAGASVDLRNNYWGSTDSTQISSWILDENDQPCVGWWCPGITTEFVPFLGQSIVPVESPSIGVLKGMYRSPK